MQKKTKNILQNHNTIYTQFCPYVHHTHNNGNLLNYIYVDDSFGPIWGVCTWIWKKKKGKEKKTAYIVRLSRIPRYLSSLLYKRGQKGKHFKAPLISWLRVFSLIVVLALLFIPLYSTSICIIVIITCLRGWAPEQPGKKDKDGVEKEKRWLFYLV